MPSVSKTWVFAADLEGLTDVGDSAITPSWSATDGNPAGSIEWLGTGTALSERARGPALTWETLFGVPAGATVISAQVTGWDELVWSLGGASARRVRMRLVTGSGVHIHDGGGGELIDETAAPTHTDGTPDAKGAGSVRTIDAGFQASSTQVKLEIIVSWTGTSSGFDIEQDNIAIQVVYSQPGPIAFDPLPFIPKGRNF